jgi:hypothetical protein
VSEFKKPLRRVLFRELLFTVLQDPVGYSEMKKNSSSPDEFKV